MGEEYIILILVPVMVFIVLILMFGNINTSPVIQDIGLIQNITQVISDRETCIEAYSQCSNEGCQLIDTDGDFGSAHGFPCGDAFYALVIVGGVIALPALIIGLPLLLMVPLTSIPFFGIVYGIADFWFIYAPLWVMEGIGLWRIIW